MSDGAVCIFCAEMLSFIVEVARRAGLVESGYRVVATTGPDARQEVTHLHWHVIGGRRLGGIA